MSEKNMKTQGKNRQKKYPKYHKKYKWIENYINSREVSLLLFF